MITATRDRSFLLYPGCEARVGDFTIVERFKSNQRVHVTRIDRIAAFMILHNIFQKY
jgi:hypothetical protein